MLNIVLLGILFILIAICIVVKSKHRIILTSLFILIGMYFGFVWGFGDSIIVKWQTQNILHAKKNNRLLNTAIKKIYVILLVIKTIS